MNIDKLQILYFSPTRTTKTVVETIADSIQCQDRQIIDLTHKRVRENSFPDADSSLAIIGSPVYYGRIPADVSAYLSNFHVNNIPAVLVVVYGNREYEDSLMELYDLTCAAGFKPIACAAFIGEHSYSSADLPIALGRPDDIDLEKAKQFGAAIQKKLEFLDGNNQIFIPGNSDYKNNAIPNFPIAPSTITDKCSLCEICIELCPVESISIDEDSKLSTNIGSCILCFACIKSCPMEAREIDDIFTQAIKIRLKQCTNRKEPEIFI